MSGVGNAAAAGGGLGGVPLSAEPAGGSLRGVGLEQLSGVGANTLAGVDAADAPALVRLLAELPRAPERGNPALAVFTGMRAPATPSAAELDALAAAAARLGEIVELPAVAAMMREVEHLLALRREVEGHRASAGGRA